MRRVVLLIAALALVAGRAEARPQYLKAFADLYPRLETTGATKCGVCHCGESKTSQNDYGRAVGRMLDGEKNIKDRGRIEKALGEAEKEPSTVPGKTFGNLIGAGKLPGVCPKRDEPFHRQPRGR